jgi:tRNA(Ile)-lysidine synthase
LNPVILQTGLTVRNWRPGDRFWPAHAKSPKKIKELLQQRHVTGPERQSWPVIAAGADVVWLRGFAASAQFLLRDPAKEALLIRERPL